MHRVWLFKYRLLCSGKSDHIFRVNTIPKQRIVKSRKKVQRAKSGPVTVKGTLDSLIRPLELLPPRLSVKMRWQDHDSAVLALETRTYAINNVYDPLYALGGYSCTFYDELAALYGRWYVTNVQVSTTFYTSGTKASTVFMIPFRSSQTVPTLNVNNIFANQRAMTHYNGFGNSVCNPYRLDYNVNLSELEGVNVGNVPDYWGASGSGPVLLPRMVIGCITNDGATVTNLDLVTIITFDVVFLHPKFDDTIG